MKISYNWLADYIDIQLAPDQVADKLTLLGLEVEEMETTGSEFDQMVVGEVLKVNSHPNADRLQICRVDLGSQIVQIVCGAPNVSSGQKVPVAVVGSTLPVPDEDGNPFTIREAELRGESSQGMICSESELGIGDDHSGILVLDSALPAGTPLAKALDIDQDTIFDIALTPNRPDASSHLGVARDLSAVLGKPVNSPYVDPVKEKYNLEDRITISIDDPKRCHRYVARIIENVSIGPSPDWLQKRLKSIGLRPVNNVVDCTNYVLHEVGQPLHAFDYDKIDSGQIQVQSFGREMKFRTLDGVDRTVPAGTLFICDGDKPVALAGIMGGEESEVDENTQTVLLESAWFLPSSIRKSSKTLTLQTDSSYRYERGIDPNLARKACDRAAKLIAELSGGEVVRGVTDKYPNRHEELSVSLRMNRLNQLLGTSIETEEAISILNSLEIQSVEKKDGLLQCTVPTFRPDITREVDLIEEVGRVYDYNNIPAPKTIPFYQPRPLEQREQLHNRIRTVATRLRYKEISTNSLLSSKEANQFSAETEQIRTLNPVSQEATTLRTTLLSGFLKVVQFNMNRNAKSLRLFEVGQTYKKSAQGSWIEGVEEHGKLLLGLCGYRTRDTWRTEAEPFTLFDLKEDLESTLLQLGLNHTELKLESNAAGLLSYRVGEKLLATLQEVSDEIRNEFDIPLPVLAAEVDITHLEELNATGHSSSYQPVAKFPPFEYDVAYIVNHATPAGDLVDTIRNTAGNVLHQLDVFDVYEGENIGNDKKSIAIRLTFLDSNKTLTIKEVEPLVKQITKDLENRFGARLRS